MSQAAKFGDPVIGVDIHMVMVPTPAGPVPTHLPHPFVGVVFDPLGAAIHAGISRATGGGGAVYVNGMPVDNTGMTVNGIAQIPTSPGTSFAPHDIPNNDGSIVTRSKTVSMADGEFVTLLQTGVGRASNSMLRFDGIRIGSQRASEAWLTHSGDEYSMKSYAVGGVPTTT